MIDILIALLNQMFRGGVGAAVVINGDGTDARDIFFPVEEYNRRIGSGQDFFDIFHIRRISGNGDENTVYLRMKQGIELLLLYRGVIMTLADNHPIAMRRQLLFQPADDRGEEVGINIRNNHTHRFGFTAFQGFGQIILLIVHFLGCSHHQLLGFLADSGMIVQRTGNRGHTHIQLFGNVVYRRVFLSHRSSVMITCLL